MTPVFNEFYDLWVHPGQSGFWGAVVAAEMNGSIFYHHRDTDASDTQIAAVKRGIDKFNQQRNDWIEKIDDWITERLAELGVAAPADAPQNTETLGSTIDRLSILALRVFHLEERLPIAAGKLRLALLQHEDLSVAAQDLADDIVSGRKRHTTYRALKLYNDPDFNPYLRPLGHLETVRP